MKLKSRLFFLSLVFLLAACADAPKPIAQKAIEQIALVPQPKYLQIGSEDPFIWDENTIIYYEPSLKQSANYLQGIFKEVLGSENQVELSSAERQISKAVHLKLSTINANPEAYELKIKADFISVEANSAAGIMRAIQTIRQLMPPAFLSQEKADAWAIPNLHIKDEPAFQHRGMLLDVCRHFFELKTIKKYVDLLALYKMNVLHLHLTEDQGWRIESEAYPKLNSVASWRMEQDGSRYGGYYTKAQLQELVAYAQERHITIIPEIELPGHSQAALAAYPQFSCLGADSTIEVVNDWGVFKEIYCAGNDETFTFLETILEEVMAIFPSEYIHIGGDEAPKYRWENCSKCQARMEAEGLVDEHELQSYFIKRIEGFLNAKGRKLIGWDEILEGGLSPKATVQSWRGIEGGIAAARAQHFAIMSPTSHCYLDYGLERIDLQKIYSFDPIPKELSPEEARYILGAECNMWTEHVPDEDNLDYKVNPRMQGLAEVLWSYPQERNFQDFYDRMQYHYPRLEALAVNYGPETVAASIYSEVYLDSAKVFIGAKRKLEQLDLKVKWKGKEGPWGFDLTESGSLSAQAYKNGSAYGDSVAQSFSYHQALACKAKYLSPFEKWYSAGGEVALVNGTLGSLNFRDGQWQGFSKNDVEVIIDLGQVKPIKRVSSNFYHYNNAWIFRPDWYRVELSKDGENWQLMGVDSPSLDPKQRGQQLINLEVLGKNEARFIKLIAKNVGTVPTWHEAAGADAWIFIDEIIVE